MRYVCGKRTTVIINDNASYCELTGYISLKGWPDIQIEEIVQDWEKMDREELIENIKDFLES